MSSLLRRSVPTWALGAIGAVAIMLAAVGPVAETNDTALAAATQGPAPQYQSRLIHGSGALASPTPAELADLKFLASERGMSLTALKASVRGMTEFSQVAQSIEDRYPDQFVRWGLSNEQEGGNFWIVFTEEPPQEVLLELASLGSDTDLITGAPSGSRELSAMAGAAVDVLAAHSADIGAVGTRFDRYGGSMTVEYTVSRSGQAPMTDDQWTAIKNQALNAIAAASNSGAVPFPVVFTEVSGTPVAENLPGGGSGPVNVRGGRELDRASNGVFECTAGFTAVYNGHRGVLTAWHCLDQITYEGGVGVISTNPVLAGQTSTGRQIDLQWHRTLTDNGHTTGKYFRATGRLDSDDRSVIYVANAGVDSPICHWGEGSEYSCAIVADVNTCRTLSGVGYCGLDITDRDISTGGDSGGPWFYGHTANGTHSGGWDGVESYFTRISRVSNNLGATVLKF